MKRAQVIALLPVLASFFVMGFCDLVGIASNYVQSDFSLSETQKNFLPSMVFIWFFVFSVPFGAFMNRVGRKNTVLISLGFTVLAMLLPLLNYSYWSCLVAFALLGIGNTILQVSLNPLLMNIMDESKLASSLTAGQFIKAISSFAGPIIAAWAAGALGNWIYMFPVFAAITLVVGCWLLFTPIPKEATKSTIWSFRPYWALLKDKTILLLFLGIVFIVGVDVGLNVMIPGFLMERCGMELSEAGYGISLYFVFRTLGAFLGTFILARFSAVKFLRMSMIITLFVFLFMLFVSESQMLLAIIAIVGFFCANVFSIIFSKALQLYPNSANELSGLMIMGISGGAVVPPLMAVFSQWTGSLNGSLVIIGLCIVYLLYSSFALKSRKE
ncbi:MFS transporter [Bacteroides sp.]